jgi:hypothetical protein
MAVPGFFLPNFWQPRPTRVAGFLSLLENPLSFFENSLSFWKISWVFRNISLNFWRTRLFKQKNAYFGAKNVKYIKNIMFYLIIETSIAGILSFSWNFSLSFLTTP